MLSKMLFSMMYAILCAGKDEVDVMPATTIGCPSLDSQWPRWGSRRRSLIRSNILRGILTIITIATSEALHL